MLITPMEISHQCDGDTLHLNLKLLRKPMHVLLSLLVCILALWYSFKKNIQCLSIRKSSTKYKVMLPNPFVFCGLDRFSGGLCNSPIIFMACCMFLTFFSGRQIWKINKIKIQKYGRVVKEIARNIPFSNKENV